MRSVWRSRALTINVHKSCVLSKQAEDKQLFAHVLSIRDRPCFRVYDWILLWHASSILRSVECLFFREVYRERARRTYRQIEGHLTIHHQPVLLHALRHLFPNLKEFMINLCIN
uniref:Uncharacterized protein n=1 Tax=Meloidogyne incognita TaxID=6306 RepID=A0A914KJP3_MELIC